jgi:tetratricopeptide (TPR) repeat protein
MIHAFLWVCLMMQTQSAEPLVQPEALTLLQSGVDAENRRDLDQAIAAFRKAADLAPSAGIVFFRLGDAYMRKRDYAEAIPPLKRAAELSPASLPVHQLLGYALLAEGYAAEAIPHLEIVHEYGALGIAQLEAGQPADAVANLQAALVKSPDDPDLDENVPRGCEGIRKGPGLAA